MTLDDIAIFENDLSAFAYPEAAVVTRLLGDGTSTENAVIQGSALPFRQARLAWDAQSTADMLAVRTLSETKEVVAFVDNDGTSHDVVVFDFGADEVVPEEVWTCTATLVEVA